MTHAVRAHDAGEYLRTAADIAAYLTAAMEESDSDPRLPLKALRNVAAAQDGVSAGRSPHEEQP